MTTSDAASAYERRCRLLMRLAYPPRFREFRGTELLGTLLDLAEPGQSSPTLRDGLDVLRGGLMLRLREHPPVGHWFLYRLMGSQVPWKYRWWARDDIQGRFFFERHVFFVVLFWGPYSMFLRSFMSNMIFTSFSASLVFLGATYLLLRPFKALLRRSWLARHEFHPDGTSYVPIPQRPALTERHTPPNRTMPEE
ncbi:hypothetical protein [Streptosporangium sp. NPDC049644]|uniref:hypothetical protein n=1 Tax=Streptosporangium sp. NPDC049644 TaxID=3155507 RepID=UPI003449B9A4